MLFHFDFGYGIDVSERLELAVGTARYPVAVHTEDTLASAARSNAALARLPEDQLRRFTHFVELPEDGLPQDRVRFMRVISAGDPGPGSLPDLFWCGVHIPEPYRRAVRVLRPTGHDGLYVHPELHAYGLAPFSAEDADEIFDAGIVLKLPIDCAKAVVFQHPDLASSEPTTAARVMDKHIMSENNVSAMNNFATAIGGQHEATTSGGWARIVQSVDASGNPLSYDYDFGARKQGEPVMHYQLSDQTASLIPDVAKGPLRTTRDDMALRNTKWSNLHAVTATHKDVGSAGQVPHTAVSRSDGPQYKWGVVNPSTAFGTSVDQGSISFSGNDFTINAANLFLRTLSAYVEFFDENGDVIEDPAGWKEVLPQALSNWETSSLKYVGTVSAVNVWLAIPAPKLTDPSILAFVWPDNAVKAKLHFGSLGTYDWDGKVSTVGAILTLVYNYMIPLLFAAAGALLESTGWLNYFTKSTERLVATIAVAGPLIGGGIATGAALGNTKNVLTTAGSAASGLLVSKGLDFAMEKVTARITAEEAAEALPFVGWGLRVAAELVDWATILETTVEVLSSSAMVTYEVARTFDLKLTLHPDPDHGEAGHPETAVWPAVADHYQVTVQYKGGTNHVMKGQIADPTSNAPLVLEFSDLPAGGDLQIIAGIYSKNGWLCGTWQSDWVAAQPKEGTELPVEGSITEKLVPLTADTQYTYDQKTVYADGTHAWKQGGEPPTVTVSSRDCGQSGAVMCDWVGITVNNKAFQVGYAWQATQQKVPFTGQTEPPGGQSYVFQNISVLSDPESRIKYPDHAFEAKPGIAYDQYGDATEGEVPANNFVIDPRNGQHHLRKIELMDGKPTVELGTDMDSWGQFPLPHMDSVVIHPHGYAIGVSWDQHKIATLQLPGAPVKDADSPIAVTASGQGVREGLLQGPKALTVTPDSRLLILETTNKRVQAFDVHGNAVPSFDGKTLLTLTDASYGTDLDGKQFSDRWQAQFQQAHLAPKFTADASFASELDQKSISQELRANFSANGATLSWDDDQVPEQPNPTVAVVETGSRWRIEDTTRAVSYDVVADNSALTVHEVIVPDIEVRKPGAEWVLRDQSNARSYHVTSSADSGLNVVEYLASFLLHDPSESDVTYLDLATESKGYVYVLLHTGQGLDATDYFLDIYEPDGTFLTRTPDPKLTATPQHPAAAKLALDVWRSAYTLNYETLTGPDSRVEPSISQWTPTPQLFQLDLTNQQSFDNGDTKAVTTLFSDHGVTLASEVTIATVSTNGHWTVTSDSATYDVIRSGGTLYVYSLPTTERGR